MQYQLAPRAPPTRFAEFAGSSRRRPASCAFFRGANSGRGTVARPWSSSPVAPDTWAVACCSASRRRGGPCARSRGSRSSLPGVEAVRGDLLTGAGLEEALEGCSTAYYLVHSMEAAANGDFAGRDRRMAEAFGEAAARAGVERIVYLGGIVPDGPAALAAPALAARGRGDPARRRARLDRAARLDRDRRRLVVVPAAGPARRAPARAAAAALAQEPHPADRRARRDRVPRPHAAGARRRRAARSTWPGRT